jgi:hypothetical protein
MKRNIALFLVLVLTIATLGFIVFADTEETPQWFLDMFKWKTEQINEAVESGELTQEQADEWLEHMEEMQAYHDENGFAFGKGMGGFGKHGGGMYGFDGDKSNFERPSTFERGSHPCFGNTTSDK